MPKFVKILVQMENSTDKGKSDHGAHMEDTTQFVSIVRAWIDQHGQ